MKRCNFRLFLPAVSLVGTRRWSPIGCGGYLLEPDDFAQSNRHHNYGGTDDPSR